MNTPVTYFKIPHVGIGSKYWEGAIQHFICNQFSNTNTEVFFNREITSLQEALNEFNFIVENNLIISMYNASELTGCSKNDDSEGYYIFIFVGEDAFHINHELLNITQIEYVNYDVDILDFIYTCGVEYFHFEILSSIKLPNSKCIEELLKHTNEDYIVNLSIDELFNILKTTGECIDVV